MENEDPLLTGLLGQDSSADLDDMTDRLPTCFGCRRYRGDSLSCEAFPDGIPDDIASGDFDHHESHDGDHGLRFVLDEGNEMAVQIETEYQRLVGGSNPQ